MKLQRYNLTKEKSDINSIQVPILIRKQNNKRLMKYERLSKFKKDLKSSFIEFDKIKAGKKKAVTLKEFLNKL